MAAKGGVLVVDRLKKQSHVAIHDPAGTLVKNADVTAAGDNGSNYKGKLKRVNTSKKVGQARLKCVRASRRPRADETETGKLQITIVGGPVVEDVPVTYVDDPDSCDEPDPPLRRKPKKKVKKKAK